MTKTEFTFQKIYYIWGIEGFAFDRTNELQFHYGLNEESIEEKAEKVCRDLRKKLKGTLQMPQVCFQEEGIIFWGFSDAEDTIYLFGPVTLEQFWGQELEHYRHRGKIKSKDYKIPYIDAVTTLGIMSISCYMILDREYSEDEIMRANTELTKMKQQDTVDYQLYRYEEDKGMQSYAEEQRWMKQIEDGAIDDVKGYDSALDMQKGGTVSKKNDYKQVEYMMVTAITLMTRAAIQGGVEPSASYEASDLFLQKLSTCKNTMEMIDVYKQARIHFTIIVHDKKAKQRLGTITEQCMAYVAGHLYGKFTISEMAKDLALNRTYMSKCFSQKMGMTIQQYIMKERLRTAANLLKYSDRSIGQIADYMQFSSAGRFSSYFKKEYGVTPHVYREKNKLIEFA